MRFRTGIIIGLGVGYYFGAKAGRERYEIIEAWLDQIRATTTYRDLTTKVSDGVREGTTAARRLVEDAAYRTADAAGGQAHDADPTAPMDLRALFSDPTLN